MLKRKRGYDGLPLGECTEILGSESAMEMMTDGSEFEVGRGQRVESEATEQKRSDEHNNDNNNAAESLMISDDSLRVERYFPPILTTLYEDGRPRFTFKKHNDEDGRLSVSMVPNIKCTRIDERLIMSVERSSDQFDEDEVNDEDDGNDHQCDDHRDESIDQEDQDCGNLSNTENGAAQAQDDHRKLKRKWEQINLPSDQVHK